MSTRPASFASRFSFLAIAAAIAVLLGAPACGRSNLDDYLVQGDGGSPPVEAGSDVHNDTTPPVEAAACNATTCPQGCCDATGTCQSGSTTAACGALGEACVNCTAEGFSLCDGTRHACGNPVTSCDGADCTGCCEGNVCFAGSDPNECGFGGSSCQHCANEGLTCNNQQCAQAPCGAINCAGCCFGQECLSGTAATACGIKGQVCTNCSASGTTCVSEGSGGFCEGTPTCSPSNCSGCCLGNTCVSGTAATECGEFGQACQNCQAESGTCVALGGGGGVCEAQTNCGPQNCAGCCEGDLCVTGDQPTECGAGGSVCTDCSAQGGFCASQGPGTGGFCQFNTGCQAGTCAGCCDQNGTCQTGSSSSACGIDGTFCTDCSVTGGTCSGGLCNNPPPVCNASTCPGGCCDGTNCLPGNLNSFCGAGGQACQDCTASGESCSANGCSGPPPTCNSTNCTGCCDGTGACQAGFIDTQCGQNGTSCEDCTVLDPSSNCDVSVSPRTCSSQQAVCPAPYPSCPSTVETPSLNQQNVCTASDLQNATSACEAGAHTSSCDQFFTFEQSDNPACAQCLGAFDYDFSELTGLTTCVAPFADAACNHITGCLVDCTDKACAGCADSGALTNCQNQVPNNVCQEYYNGAQCIQNAFFGAGSFCNPQTGFFGDWLGQVGQFYCAQ